MLPYDVMVDAIRVVKHGLCGGLFRADALIEGIKLAAQPLALVGSINLRIRSVVCFLCCLQLGLRRGNLRTDLLGGGENLFRISSPADFSDGDDASGG